MSDSNEWDDLLKEEMASVLEPRLQTARSAHGLGPRPSQEWEELLEEAEAVFEKSSQDVQDACDDCSSTESEYQSPQCQSEKNWWVSLCRQAFHAQGIAWPGAPSAPLVVVSCCTGCSAESAVMEARHLFVPALFLRAEYTVQL
eukprot:s1666_g5.t1